MKKLVIAVLAIALIVGGIMAIKAYNAGPRDLSTESSDIEIDARALFDAFATDEANANAQYLDKVISVSGTVSDVRQGPPQTIDLETDDMLGLVSCEMAEPAEDITPGQSVSIKGQCTGYLSDVILVKCIIEK